MCVFFSLWSYEFRKGGHCEATPHSVTSSNWENSPIRRSPGAGIDRTYLPPFHIAFSIYIFRPSTLLFRERRATTLAIIVPLSLRSVNLFSRTQPILLNTVETRFTPWVRRGTSIRIVYTQRRSITSRDLHQLAFSRCNKRWTQRHQKIKLTSLLEERYTGQLKSCRPCL